MNDMSVYHKNCYNHLMKIKKEDDNFLFMLRHRNSLRIEKKYYFIGNDNYLQIGFWKGTDYNHKIYFIGFDINSEGNSYIELTSVYDEEIASHIKRIKEIIESNLNIIFNRVRNLNKWQYFYDSENYISNLQSFIDNIIPIIDEYIKNNPSCTFVYPTNEEFYKWQKKFINIDDGGGDEDEIIIKDDIPVHQISEYIKHQEHLKISLGLEQYLISHGFNNVKREKDNIDLVANDSNKKLLYFEIKTAETVRLNIRQAIGQLLEYSHYKVRKKIPHKMIIVSTKLYYSFEDINYLNLLCTQYHLPLEYWQYDYKTKEVEVLFK